MSFLEMAQAMAPFTLFCLFYFYYRVNKLEKFFVLYQQKLDKERKEMVKVIDEQGQRIAYIENFLMQLQGTIENDSTDSADVQETETSGEETEGGTLSEKC